MIIAISDKECINKIPKEYKIIYAFGSKFNFSDLLEVSKLGIECINYNYIDKVDINLSKFKIKCRKKANINDEDVFVIPPKKDYKFSIIVPNYNNDHGDYNGKTFFENCIESILNQTYKNFELIIVDDMSTDTSVKTVENFMEKISEDLYGDVGKVMLIRNKRKRYNGGSRNVGIEAVSVNTDYICFLDSDDWWKDNKVLEKVNNELNGEDMALIGLELLDERGIYMTKFHEYDTPEDFFLSNNKVWCTAWSRFIRKDKIVYFCEDTLMEDRVWSYLQADNVDYDNVLNIKESLYVWNRLNKSNSVSLKKGNIWNASAYCHIGHQLMLQDKLKHKEYRKLLDDRIKKCKELVNNGIYQQY